MRAAKSAHIPPAALIDCTNGKKGTERMKAYIEERAREVAEHIIATGQTVRQAAGHFRISKSTVHKDVTERLREIDPPLCERVGRVLEKNREERHIRGGLATRRKYEQSRG